MYYYCAVLTQRLYANRHPHACEIGADQVGLFSSKSLPAGDLQIKLCCGSVCELPHSLGKYGLEVTSLHGHLATQLIELGRLCFCILTELLEDQLGCLHLLWGERLPSLTFWNERT